jgi:hypothetical protein
MYELNDSMDDFDDAGLRVEAVEGISFKEAVMLVCRWWYPTKDAPHSVVDAIHVTRAEPTEKGVAVIAKLHLIARPVATEVGAGVQVTGRSVTCILVGQEMADALTDIESGVDPLYTRFNSDKDLAKAISLNVEALAGIYLRSSLEGLIVLSQSQKVPQRL